jgi:superfamily II DNA or RNA helicase/HKD family nuclease
VPKLPAGLYDLPITAAIARELAQLDRTRFGFELSDYDPADSDLNLARHAAAVFRQTLAGIRGDDRIEAQAKIVNELLVSLAARTGGEEAGEQLSPPFRRLASIHPIDPLRGETRHSDPLIPLAQSDLLVNARGEPSVGQAVAREIDSADRIDLICAFIKWHGLRLLEEPLEAYLRSGRSLRVITTTYVGATERKALDRLVEMGADVKVSYQVDTTRLHAKAWLFHRESGFSTAFIGSSNLSKSALLDGVEWNVRLSQIDAPTIVDKFAATFDSYWADPSFERYTAAEGERFDDAIGRARGESEPTILVPFTIEPWPHQREMLDELMVERYRHDRWRNLVVAATGTGKTVIAAFDYKRLSDDLASGRPLKLLFVAHRREILQQSLITFRNVLRDGAFGELYVDGHRPDEWQHVFASVQSLATIDLEQVAPDAFDVIIVDEFHHAAAPTYRRLLDYFQPQVLLGLTATPERADGESILHWFGGRIASELRLWDALDRQLLAPFHYFGLADQVDLSQVRWTRGAYDRAELEKVYIGADARVAQVLADLHRKVTDVRTMRALGFCVSIEHGRYMARRFNEAGVPSLAVSSESTSAERDDALRRLKLRDINCIFAVDLFNEGVDVPEIDTVLFLRPTESATVFLQQLGRGLRRTAGKDCLTVLDFIGNANRNFRFDLRYRAITGATRAEVVDQVERGFPLLPAGCSIQLDRVARQRVLENLKQAIGSRFSTLVRELRSIGRPVTLLEFTREAGIDVEDVYRNRGWSWTRLQREAGVAGSEALERLRIADAVEPSLTGDSDAEPDAERLLTGAPRLLHIEDRERIGMLRAILTHALPPLDALSIRQRRILEGLMLTLAPDAAGIEALLLDLGRSVAVRNELLELLDVIEDRAGHQPISLTEVLPEAPQFAEVPLALHARYTRDEVLAAVGRSTFEKKITHREGPFRDEATGTDYFFITLEKSEKYYSPSTRYRDYAVSPDLFHWESQSTTSESSPTGQRYIHHQQRGSQVMLLVRPSNKDAWGRTPPFTFLGPATYVSHTGSRPMAILWRLHRPMPLDLFKVAKVASG